MKVSHFITIPGQPIGKARARITRTGHAYTPAKTQRWEDAAAALIRSRIGSPMYDQPLKLEAFAYFDRPQRLLRKSSPLNRVHHTAKPDADNIVKIVSDALVKAGVVRDDAIINMMMCVKYYRPLREGPSVSIMLTSWENEE